MCVVRESLTLWFWCTQERTNERERTKEAANSSLNSTLRADAELSRSLSENLSYLRTKRKPEINPREENRGDYATFCGQEHTKKQDTCIESMRVYLAVAFKYSARVPEQFGLSGSQIQWLSDN